jgi:FkbM family methyltransferase
MHGARMALQIRKAMWASPAGESVSISIPGWTHPVCLRAGSSDAAVFTQVFLDRQGFFPVSGSPRFVVDAGANIGLMSLCLANRFPQCEIVALEVDGANYRMLAENCRPYSSITPLHIGLWSHSTSLLIDNPGADSWSFQTKEVPYGTAGAITAIGMADLLERYGHSRIDILKLDVEGSEYEILSRGLAEWVDRVLTIVVEIHERIKPGVTELVLSSLTREGFSNSRFGDWWCFARR